MIWTEQHANYLDGSGSKKAMKRFPQVRWPVNFMGRPEDPMLTLEIDGKPFPDALCAPGRYPRLGPTNNGRTWWREPFRANDNSVTWEAAKYAKALGMTLDGRMKKV